MTLTIRLVRYQPRGFTALEVIMATALASLMMVAVLGVLSGIAAKERILGEQEEASPYWHRPFKQRLQRDLEGASTYSQRGDSIVIEGFGGRRNGVPAWAPVQIHYRIQKAGDQSLLIRDVVPLVQPSEQFPKQIVCLGVDSIQLEMIDQQESGGSSFTEPGDEPPRLRVVLFRDNKIVLSERVGGPRAS
ncbi:MAG: hypothetical protein AAGG48_23710 [Planctomycetota bacterium]